MSLFVYITLSTSASSFIGVSEIYRPTNLTRLVLLPVQCAVVKPVRHMQVADTTGPGGPISHFAIRIAVVWRYVDRYADRFVDPYTDRRHLAPCGSLCGSLCRSLCGSPLLGGQILTVRRRLWAARQCSEDKDRDESTLVEQINDT